MMKPVALSTIVYNWQFVSEMLRSSVTEEAAILVFQHVQIWNLTSEANGTQCILINRSEVIWVWAGRDIECKAHND